MLRALEEAEEKLARTLAGSRWVKGVVLQDGLYIKTLG
jgi:hypothetical protein